MNYNRKQMLYQKTDFNYHKIAHLDGIFHCCKCKKYNNVIYHNNQVQNSNQTQKHLAQCCMFCGTPNNIHSSYTRKNI